MSLPPVSSSPESTSQTPPASWGRRRLVDPVLQILRQGLAPEQLALTVAVGICLGVVPMLGITTMLGIFMAMRLRLNVAAMQLVSHLASPVQLLLLIPFLRLGARLLGGASRHELSLAYVRHLITHDWRAALQLLWRAELGAMLVWAGAALPVGALLYFGFLPVFRRVMARQIAGTATENSQS